MTDEIPTLEEAETDSVWAISLPLNERQQLGIVDEGDGTSELFVHDHGDDENQVRVIGTLNMRPQDVIRAFNVIATAMSGNPEVLVSVGAEAHQEYMAARDADRSS